MNPIAVAQSSLRGRRKRPFLLGLALLGSIASIWPITVQASTATRYQEALTQVAHQQVPLNLQVQESIATVKTRFPGAALAACAATGSMKPTLDENFIAVLEDCPFSRLGTSDIILIRLGTSARYAAVMHRIVNKAGMGNLQTKGDALENPDQLYTTSSNYLGKRVVAAIHRQTGTISWLLWENAQPVHAP